MDKYWQSLPEKTPRQKKKNLGAKTEYLLYQVQGFGGDDPLHPLRVNMQLSALLVILLIVFKTLVLLGLNVQLVFVNTVLLIPHPVVRKRLLTRRFISILTKCYLLAVDVVP